MTREGTLAEPQYNYNVSASRASLPQGQVHVSFSSYLRIHGNELALTVLCGGSLLSVCNVCLQPRVTVSVSQTHSDISNFGESGFYFENEATRGTAPAEQIEIHP